jgi:UDP-N-acetylmuramoyl-L-alanyl-D-glutamate--2,6-diaminopimelate ligase
MTAKERHITVEQMLKDLPLQNVAGDMSRPVLGLSLDSRGVVSSGAFAAMKGSTSDGHDYITAATENGAQIILCEDWPRERKDNVTYVQIDNLRVQLSNIAANYYGRPADHLKMVAVTGTNGKTSVATMGYQALRHMGYKVGLLSTAGFKINDENFEATHTTPDPISLHDLLAQMVEEGCEWCWMEVSSHALDQGRTEGIPFSAAIFTNLSHEHLDYHGDFASYRNCKKKLFDQLTSEAVAIINKNDKNGTVMIQNSNANTVYYSIGSMADYSLKILEQSLEGMIVKLDGQELHLILNGHYNAANMLAVYATLIEMGQSKEEVLVALSKVTGAEGRFQKIFDGSGHRLGIVDFAHTPDALEKVLTAIEGVNTKGGRVLTVVGCGGDRDRTKRPKMAQIAAEKSDKVILTSDNPRTEVPEAIIEEMKTGIDETMAHKVVSVTDRRQAIQVAASMAEPGDIVLVAGKGHEKYQEINNKRVVFDDVQVLKEALK